MTNAFPPGLRWRTVFSLASSALCLTACSDPVRPVVSSDGTIAYRIENGIVLTRLDTSEPRRFTQLVETDAQCPSKWSLAWAPSGKALAFRCEIGAARPDGEGVIERDGSLLAILDPASGSVSHVHRSKAGIGIPAWSPDGTTLSWCAEQPKDQQTPERRSVLYALAVEKGRAKGAPRELSANCWPAHAWAPDGSQIAVGVAVTPWDGELGGLWQIVLVDPASKVKPRSIATTRAPLWMEFAKDGRHLFFTANAVELPSASWTEGFLENVGVFSLDLELGVISRLSQGSRRMIYAAQSPSGSRLLLYPYPDDHANGIQVLGRGLERRRSVQNENDLFVPFWLDDRYVMVAQKRTYVEDGETVTRVEILRRDVEGQTGLFVNNRFPGIDLEEDD